MCPIQTKGRVFSTTKTFPAQIAPFHSLARVQEMIWPWNSPGPKYIVRFLVACSGACLTPRGAVQFFPTRMLGFRRGSKLGSESAEARPSLAMMMMRVKKPRTPTRRIMNTLCFHDKDVFFEPVRFLNEYII